MTFSILTQKCKRIDMLSSGQNSQLSMLGVFERSTLSLESVSYRGPNSKSSNFFSYVTILGCSCPQIYHICMDATNIQGMLDEWGMGMNGD